MVDLLNAIEPAITYSNAVLLAVLPQVTDFANRLDLPVERPITTNSVRVFKRSKDENDPGGMLLSTNGVQFWFSHGMTFGYRSTKSYYSQQDPDVVPEFYGQLKMSPDDAVQLVRGAMAKLEHDKDPMFLDLPPTIAGPGRVGTNVVPYFELTWRDPRDGATVLTAEVNAQSRSIESLWLTSAQLWRDQINLQSKSSVRSTVGQTGGTYDKQSIGSLLIPIQNVAKEMGLGLADPLDVGQVKSCTTKKAGNAIIGEIEFANGFRFICSEREVFRFATPDIFFDKNKRIKVRDFLGTAMLEEGQVLKLVRERVGALGYVDGKFLDESPDVRPPVIEGTNLIPRLFFNWNKSEAGKPIARVEVEVDSSNGKIKYFWQFDIRSPATVNSGPKNPKGVPDEPKVPKEK